MVDGKRLENLLQWEAGRQLIGDRKPEHFEEKPSRIPGTCC